MRATRDEDCRRCAHFRNDPAYLEAMLPASPRWARPMRATRAEDGLCQRHDRFAGPHGWCKDFHRRDDAPSDSLELRVIRVDATPNAQGPNHRWLGA